MTVVSRRVLVPMVGKSELALERAKRLEGILERLGAGVRTCKVLAGEGVGSLEILSRFADFTAASKVNAALQGDAEMQRLWKEREKDPSADVFGPYVYRTVFGEVSKLPVLVQREYRMPRKNLPEALKLLPEASAAVAHKPMVALIPVFAPEMDRLLITYYSESIEEMGRNLDTYGMSEAFQSVVQKASQYGELIKARVIAQV